MMDSELKKTSVRANSLEKKRFEMMLASYDTAKRSVAVDMKKSQLYFKQRLKRYKDRQREIVSTRSDPASASIEEFMFRQLRRRSELNLASARSQPRPQTWSHPQTSTLRPQTVSFQPPDGLRASTAIPRAVSYQGLSNDYAQMAGVVSRRQTENNEGLLHPKGSAMGRGRIKETENGPTHRTALPHEKKTHSNIAQEEKVNGRASRTTDMDTVNGKILQKSVVIGGTTHEGAIKGALRARVVNGGTSHDMVTSRGIEQEDVTHKYTTQRGVANEETAQKGVVNGGTGFGCTVNEEITNGGTDKKESSLGGVASSDESEHSLGIIDEGVVNGRSTNTTSSSSSLAYEEGEDFAKISHCRRSKVDLRPCAAWSVVRRCLKAADNGDVNGKDYKPSPYGKGNSSTSSQLKLLHLRDGGMGTPSRQTRYFNDEEIEERCTFYRFLLHGYRQLERESLERLTNRVQQFCGKNGIPSSAITLPDASTNKDNNSSSVITLPDAPSKNGNSAAKITVFDNGVRNKSGKPQLQKTPSVLRLTVPPGIPPIIHEAMRISFTPRPSVLQNNDVGSYSLKLSRSKTQ